MLSPAEGEAAREDDVAYARRFVPEAMCDAGTGTLIAQHGCGTITGPERRPFHRNAQPSLKSWFVGQLAGQQAGTQPLSTVRPYPVLAAGTAEFASYRSLASAAVLLRSGLFALVVDYHMTDLLNVTTW